MKDRNNNKTSIILTKSNIKLFVLIINTLMKILTNGYKLATVSFYMYKVFVIINHINLSHYGKEENLE